MTTETTIDVKNKIRSVKDFPKPGIIFRDITTALKDPETLKVMIDYLCDQNRLYSRYRKPRIYIWNANGIQT